MAPALSAALVCAMALLVPGAAQLSAVGKLCSPGDPEGTCSAGASVSDDEGASALQVRRERGSDDDEEVLQTGLAALQRANQTSGFVITTSAVLATVVGTLTRVAVAKMVKLAFDYLTGPDNFQKAVGPFGLPLSIGVINDTPEPVLFSDFQLRDGYAWGYPALKNHIMPGEMMQWFLYTESKKVEATMMFQSGGTNWGIAVANHRLGSWFTGCDRLRCNAVADSNMTAALDGLCWSNGGAHGAGIRRQGSYKVTILLGEVLQRLRQDSGPASSSLPAVGPQDVGAACYHPGGGDGRATCDWYHTCLAERFPSCKDHPSEYAESYGRKYCQRFADDSSKFSASGKVWIDSVKLCLQQRLVKDLLRPDSQAAACEEVRHAAFKSHARCYLEPSPDDTSIGLCSLVLSSPLDVVQILETTWDALWSLEAIQQILSVAKGCALRTLLGGIMSRLEEDGYDAVAGQVAALIEAEEPLEAPAQKGQRAAGLLAVDAAHGALQQANQTSKFIIISSAVVVTTIVGTLASAAVNRAFNYFAGWDEFQWAVGATGLPLTIGVINDTPEPVQYADFRLGDGTAWGFPALMNRIQPGEMMQWFLYTQTSAVEATMLFQAGGKSWSIGAALYRYGNLFTGCDRLRSKAVLGSNMDTALEGLCASDGGNAEAVHVQGGYQLIVLLSKIGAR